MNEAAGTFDFYQREKRAFWVELFTGGSCGVFCSLTLWTLGIPLATGRLHHLLFYILGLSAGLLAGLAVSFLRSFTAKLARQDAPSGWLFRAVLSTPLIILDYIIICVLFAFFIARPLLVYGDSKDTMISILMVFLFAAGLCAASLLILQITRSSLNYRAAAVFLVFISSGAVLAARRGPGPDPRVILVTIDTLRADHVGFFGYGRDTTPFIDSMCKRGAVFKNAYTPCPVTDPAHVSMLTGLLPRRTGVIYNGYPVNLSRASSIAQVLRSEGFATAAITSRVHLDPYSLSVPGFSRNSSPLPKALDTPASEATRRAAVWLRRNTQGPVFLWVHYWDPHAPYFPPESFRERFAPGVESRGMAPVWLPRTGSLSDERVSALVSLYDGEVAYADSELEKLFRFTEELFQGKGRVTWVVASDHGEILGDIQDRHPYGFGHAEFLYEPAVRVPWIIVDPDLDHVVIQEPVSTLDLCPTLLDLLGKPRPGPCDGVSRDALVKGGKGGRERSAVFFERWLPEGGPVPVANEHLAGLVLGGYKWMGTPSGRDQLYLLSSDPGEDDNRAMKDKRKARAMRKVWEQWNMEHPGTQPSKSNLPVTAQEFRALGYFR